MPYQAVVVNRTPFTSEKFVLAAFDGQEAVLILVNATFDVNHRGVLDLAEAQRSIVLVDQHFGDPVRSSIRYESQLALDKPFVDVLVRGHVWAPRGRPATEVSAGLRVGTLRKVLVATGDRSWRMSPLGLTPGPPEPFERLPLIYERAFGGTFEETVYLPNPVGVGYRRARSSDPDIRTEVPNFEYPNARVSTPSDTVTPAGFGVIGRGWQPRIQYAGTFDREWLATRWPLLPEDFDSRYHQAAPQDQQLPSLVGGEPVVLVNLSADGELRFALPTYSLAAKYVYDRGDVNRDLHLDTVLLEPDERQVTLTWRAMAITRRSRGNLREIVIADPIAMEPTAFEAISVAGTVQWRASWR
ncbi:MAG TPA: DUF2169 domain-containing protein [Candidatus Methylomirabilis sp.]|nr:DUF2169 domain-containing protein [Vicinamibacterales bacterium]HXJ84290.1 DUF2169 domain-containing protein [Candidatus Methylomirabilis sp.]